MVAHDGFRGAPRIFLKQTGKLIFHAQGHMPICEEGTFGHSGNNPDGGVDLAIPESSDLFHAFSFPTWALHAGKLALWSV
jgi:hypothetical protein